MIRDTYTPEAIQALKRIKYVCLTVLLLTSVESLSLETIFNWVAKIIWDFIAFALLYAVIGPENSRHYLT